MREAVGGSMLFYIILIFIFIYIVFIGVIVNYAATYRAANYVVTTLEQTEGRPLDLSNTSDLCDSLRRVRGYHNKITLICRPNQNGDAIYQVYTYVTFDLPFLTRTWDLPIVSETKALYDEPCRIDPNIEIEACR